MAGPAGPCEWCGGPQHWTFIRDELYVSCDGGCLPLSLEGLVPPPDGDQDDAELDGLVHIGTFLKGVGREAPEGSAARTSTTDPDELPF